VFKSFKALFTFCVAFWAFPASVVTLHHHSRQSPWCPMPMWNLEFKGNRCTEQPKTQSFIHTGRFKKRQHQRLWENRKDLKFV